VITISVPLVVVVVKVVVVSSKTMIVIANGEKDFGDCFFSWQICST